MSNTHLTQCPHCQATFKVQDQHLNAAGGKVRCGSCLEVFNALENLIDAVKQPAPRQQDMSDHAQPPAPSQKTTTETVTSPNDVDDTEFLFADNPDEDSEDDDYAGPGTFSSELSDSFLEIDEAHSGHFSDNALSDDLSDSINGKKTSSDESWAEQMLEDIKTSGSEDTTAFQGTTGSKETTGSQNTRDTEKAIELNAGNRPQPGDSYSFSGQLTTPEQEPSTESTLNISADKAEAGHSEQPPANEPHPYASPDLSLQYQNLQVDPLDLPHASERSFFGTLVWTLLNLMLLITLLAQLAWFHYDKLAQFEQLRPIYEKGCQLVGCKLPDLVDTSKIRSQNLVVRSHPTVRKALIIDAIIINQAPYEQPFPNLALYFSDLNNNIIAQRLFEPGDYLAGEVKEWTGMPKDTPIHISIEIIDPGKDAVNYSVGFFKHTPRHDSEHQL